MEIVFMIEIKIKGLKEVVAVVNNLIVNIIIMMIMQTMLMEVTVKVQWSNNISLTYMNKKDLKEIGYYF